MTEGARIKSAQQRLGVIEWLRPGEYARADEMIEDLKALNIPRLRTGFSWADWHTPEGKEWFDWLMPRVANEIELLPCFTYTPPSLGIEAKTSSPPRDPKAFADFIDVMITEHGQHFEWIELWNEPNNLNDWDWRLDPNWEIFSEMISMAAYWAQARGKKTALAGMAPTDPNWLDLVCSRDVLKNIDAVGMHGFPGTWDFGWEKWTPKVQSVRDVLDRHNLNPQIWVTEVGYSTWRHDEIVQVSKLMDVLDAPVDRVYWYSGFDLHPHECHQDGFHEDERHYHFGLKRADGTPKLIYRVWKDRGLSGLFELADTLNNSSPGLRREPAEILRENSVSIVPPPRATKPVLITGGAGFVGINLADRLLEEGEPVLIFDNLSRAGVEKNIEWLFEKHGTRVQLEIADIRDRYLIRDAVQQASSIYHFAAQVAVTTSIATPQQDLDINLQGTVNILENLRQMDYPPPLLFTSTNKVYGALDHVTLEKKDRRYQPKSNDFFQGINEHQPLNFQSPYGCSKGAADQYILDYARTYQLPAALFRMSCIYGPHQFGTEDQGWVAHFLLQAIKGLPLTLYGDGCQVRDILFVEDLVNAMLLARRHIARIAGCAFNIGGGVKNSISLLELITRIEKLTGKRCHYSFANWRVGDQKYYVTDTRCFEKMTGWQATTSMDAGLAQLYDWISTNEFGAQPLESSATSEQSLSVKGASHNVR